MNIVGIDEVGRGCWAGPLVAGAVMLHEPIAGLRDSKKLSKKERERLSALIRQSAGYGLGWVSPAEIDSIGLTAAVSLAMQRALDQIDGTIDRIIIDGSFNFLPGTPHVDTLIKADDLVPAVSAASIIAKVTRDSYMAEQDEHYPDYGFSHHVGYGTALHREKLMKYGVNELHRRSFKPIKALLQ
jgi:ribonuclease HII